MKTIKSQVWLPYALYRGSGLSCFGYVGTFLFPINLFTITTFAHRIYEDEMLKSTTSHQGLYDEILIFSFKHWVIVPYIIKQKIRALQ